MKEPIPGIEGKITAREFLAKLKDLVEGIKNKTGAEKKHMSGEAVVTGLKFMFADGTHRALSVANPKGENCKIKVKSSGRNLSFSVEFDNGVQSLMQDIPPEELRVREKEAHYEKGHREVILKD